MAGSPRPRGLLWVRRILKAALILVLALVAAAGGYLGYVSLRHARTVTLPAPTGPYRVGRTMTEWTDGTRTDPLAPRPDVKRQLSVWLWYPAARNATGPRAPYAPGPWNQLHFGGILGLGESSFSAIHTHAIDNAPAGPGRFPVVILQPGLGLSAPQYTTLAENLAGRGYIVAGVTPTYSANVTVLHGRVIHATKAGNPPFDGPSLHTGKDGQDGSRLVGVWGTDARAVATRIRMLDAAGRLARHVDTRHTIYVGHSLGGASALEACRTDPHCAGAADLDGTQFGPVVHTGLTKPLLILTSQSSACLTGTCKPTGPAEQADQTAARSLLAASTGTAWCHTLEGTEHFNFSDYSAYYIAAPLRGLLPLGPIDGKQALKSTVAYLTAFVDRTAGKRSGALLASARCEAPVDAAR